MKVAGYIERKSMLYRTGVEYGDYTMNHVLGCAHGCKFPCYAFFQKKRLGQIETYGDWCKPYLVSNTMELLYNEQANLVMKFCEENGIQYHIKEKTITKELQGD